MQGNSQKARVLRTMKETGIASRNYFLDLTYGDKITRLGAIICLLRNEGYDIITEITEHDTLYHLKEKRIERTIIKFPEGYRLVEKKVYI